MHRRWCLRIAEPAKALATPAAEPPAVMIMEEPQSGSAMEQWAGQLQKRFPSTLRLLRTSDPLKSPSESASLEQVRLPLDPDPLVWDAAARRALMMGTWLSSEAVKKLVAKLRKLPAVPAVYTRVVEELRSPSATFEFVAEVIATDPLMSAKMLQMANSAYFGLARRITSPAEAVLHLGFERVKGLILLANMFSRIDSSLAADLGVNHIWEHSLETANLAQTIASQTGADEKLAGSAFTAGLLHDVGKLLIAGNIPSEYLKVVRQACESHLSLHEVETLVFGASHAEIGGVLLGTWGLPIELMSAVGWHHSPQKAGEDTFSALTAVHVANAFANERRLQTSQDTFLNVNISYLRDLGLESQLKPWRTACRMERGAPNTSKA